jgi:hypothetical protein
MLFHLPSFVLGYASGLFTALVAPRLKPMALDIAAAGYRLFDALAVRAARGREDLEDLLAEARARARHGRQAARPS